MKMKVDNMTPFQNFTKEDFATNNLETMLGWCKSHFGKYRYLPELADRLLHHINKTSNNIL